LRRPQIGLSFWRRRLMKRWSSCERLHDLFGPICVDINAAMRPVRPMRDDIVSKGSN
jgi:hypothetical protein